MGFSSTPPDTSGTTDTTDSVISALNAATRLIQTQRIVAQMLLQGLTK